MVVIKGAKTSRAATLLLVRLRGRARACLGGSNRPGAGPCGLQPT
jgi:hypothetical protein